jgi:hypothetical protein
MAFLPTGLVKATGQRFTILPVSNPVGFFFEAMYQTGPYWHFIGLMQITAAVLLLIPSTATVGALMFLPIAVSIALITWGIGFGNTVFIGFGMVLSAVYLVCWDGDRIWAAGTRLVGARQERPLLEGAHVIEKAGWALGGSVGIGLFLVTRGFLPRAWTLGMLVSGAAAAAMVMAGWVAGGLSRRKHALPG